MTQKRETAPPDDGFTRGWLGDHMQGSQKPSYWQYRLTARGTNRTGAP